MNITRVGVDIAKAVFHVHGADRHDQIQWQAKLKRNQWLDALCERVAPLVWRPVRLRTIGGESCRSGVILSS